VRTSLKEYGLASSLVLNTWCGNGVVRKKNSKRRRQSRYRATLCCKGLYTSCFNQSCCPCGDVQHPFTPLQPTEGRVMSGWGSGAKNYPWTLLLLGRALDESHAWSDWVRGRTVPPSVVTVDCITSLGCPGMNTLVRTVPSGSTSPSSDSSTTLYTMQFFPTTFLAVTFMSRQPST
jgi:hypothetical protein